MLKILSQPCSPKTLKRDPQPNKPCSTHGFKNVMKKIKRRLPIRKVCRSSQTFKASTANLSSSRPHMHSSQLSFCLSKKKQKSMRFLEPWTSMAMVSSQRMRFRKDIRNISDSACPMRRSIKCSRKSTLTTVEPLTTPNLSLPQ